MTDRAALRVLVVDDDFRVAGVHADALSSAGGIAVVGKATTLAQARQVLDSRAVDLVIADEYLPDGSGSALIGYADASVILVTASTAAETVRRALARGAIGYIVKPFPMLMLLERVGAYHAFLRATQVGDDLNQAQIDALVSQLRPRPTGRRLPKGRSQVTAEAIIRVLRERGTPQTAISIADQIGISRATAQRYLSDLVADGSVTLALRYGSTGRPEHSYQWCG
ncbi:MAG: response regulator [Actinomycetia bacterium]|nr:response regulator [Actinomycetes bacterium]